MTPSQICFSSFFFLKGPRQARILQEHPLGSWSVNGAVPAIEIVPSGLSAAWPVVASAG
jgi:hypothetical protein